MRRRHWIYVSLAAVLLLIGFALAATPPPAYPASVAPRFAIATAAVREGNSEVFLLDTQTGRSWKFTHFRDFTVPAWVPLWQINTEEDRKAFLKSIEQVGAP